MSNTFATLIIPAVLGAKAIAITDALGYPHKGMFASQVSETDESEIVGYISTGILDSTSPLLGTAAELWAAVQAGDKGAVVLADCQAVKAAIDASAAEPHGRMAMIVNEVKTGATAPAWVQPTGAHDAYDLSAAVQHKGKGWRSLVAANVWEPSVTAWRELWGTGGAPDPYPAWVQPLGAHDAYPKDAQVSHAGKKWKSKIAANVWAPAVGALWLEVP